MLRKRGFTLIELSLVLLIVALLAGGVLLGREMIENARLQKQVTQFQKLIAATNTFKLKYHGLPGDLYRAERFGFKPRGNYGGMGDGNGIIEGNWGGFATNRMGYPQNGENMTFWVDLSQAGLIEGSFTTASPTTCPPADISGSDLDLYYPRAALQEDSYIYVSSDSASGRDGEQYFQLSPISLVAVGCGSGQIGLGQVRSTATLSVIKSYMLDSKMDDGRPTTGAMQARYLNMNTCGGTFTSCMRWAGTASDSVAVSASATTCYDNAGDTTNPVIYSTAINDGSGANCALSLKW